MVCNPKNIVKSYNYAKDGLKGLNETALNEDSASFILYFDSLPVDESTLKRRFTKLRKLLYMLLLKEAKMRELADHDKLPTIHPESDDDPLPKFLLPVINVNGSKWFHVFVMVSISQKLLIQRPSVLYFAIKFHYKLILGIVVYTHV